MSALQSYLRSGGTVAELLEKYAIKSVQHREYPNLRLFKYNQIASQIGDPIVQHARGVILDESDNWRIIARPFDKFFNHGEGHAAQIDWSTARVGEKVDGSLIVLYYYASAWQVATTGLPDASGDVNGTGQTFAALFWRVLDEMGLGVPPAGAEHLTFMFELTTPYNRIVVRHADRRVTLLAVRSRDAGGYWPLDLFPYPAARTFPLQSFADIEATFAHLDPLAQEGYVVEDSSGRRVKVKHPGYVAIHHMRDGFGPRRILEVIRSSESSEVLTHFPEWKPDFDKLQAKYDALCATVAADFDRLRGIETQKDFALQAVKTPCSAALFQLRKGTIATPREYFAVMQIRNLMELLRVEDAEETRTDQ